MGIATLKAEAVKYIAIHCSATPGNRNIGAKELDRMHRERGFLMIGYHRVIRRDGTLENGRRLDQVGAHVEGHNSESIGICMVGGVNKLLVPEDNFTLDQYHALAMLLIELHLQFPKAITQGHRDFPNVAKACPSWDVKPWYAETVAPHL